MSEQASEQATCQRRRQDPAAQSPHARTKTDAMAGRPDTARASAPASIPTTTTSASPASAIALALAATATATATPTTPTTPTTTTTTTSNSTSKRTRTPDGPSLDRRSPPSGPLSHSTYHAHRQNHNPSKLPTFRFTDLRKETLNRPSFPPGIPSPVSPAETGAAEAQTRHLADVYEATRVPSPPSLPGDHNRRQSARHNHHDSISHDASSVTNTAAVALPPDANPVPPRLPAFQFTANSALQSSAPPVTPKSLKRSSSSAQLTSDDARSFAADSAVTVVAPARPLRKRVSHSWSAAHSTHEASRRPVVKHHRLHSVGSIHRPSDDAASPRELLVLKTVQRTASDDKRSSLSRRPPLSYKPATPASPSAGGTASIPPIRSFRSSGSRRSFGLDMNLRSPRGYDDEPSNGNHRDQTLRALEGRQDDDATIRWVPPSAGAADRPDADDDSGDVFLKMAREEPEGKRAPAIVSLPGPRLCLRDPTNPSRSRESPGRPTAGPSPLPWFPTSPPRPLRSRDACPSRKAVGLMAATRRKSHAAIRIWKRPELGGTAPRYGLQPSSHQLCPLRISSLMPAPSTAAFFGDPRSPSQTQAPLLACRR